MSLCRGRRTGRSGTEDRIHKRESEPQPGQALLSATAFLPKTRTAQRCTVACCRCFEQRVNQEVRDCCLDTVSLPFALSGGISTVGCYLNYLETETVIFLPVFSIEQEGAGVAAPLGCVICLQLGDVAVFSLCAQYFLNVRGEGWYHYPQRALRAAETLDSRLSKRLTCRFLRSGEQRSLRSAYFLRIYRIFCRQFQLQTLLRYGTIKTDEPRTLDFSGVRGFLVTNVCIVQRSAA